MKFSSNGGTSNHQFSSNNARPSSAPSNSNGMRSTQQRSSAPRSTQQRSTSQSQPVQQYTAPPPTPRYRQRRSNNYGALLNMGAAYLGSRLGTRSNTSRTSVKAPKFGFLKGVLIAAILVGLAWLIITQIVPMFQKQQTVEPVTQQSVIKQVWSPASTNTSGETTNGYYLCNNTIREAYTVPFKDDSSKLSLKVKAFHSTDAESAIDMRNSHFYDVIQLIKKQGANPSNHIYEIEYIGVGEAEDGGQDIDIIYFVLDENLILDIQDGYITYNNLYEYCLDLWLHDALK